MSQAPSIELVNIRKTYGPTVALAGVSFSVAQGAAQALLGENGAGKSTIVKILSGLVAPDAGEVRVDGRPVRFRSPRDARAAGIVTAAQELALVPHLTVAQNLFLGREPRSRLGLVSSSRLAAEARRVCAEFDLHNFDPDAPAGELSLSARQQLELVRLLNGRGHVLLLDEPTSALGAHEVAWLFGQITKAREGGATVVFVSHRMGEIRELCDSVTVLRNGRHVASIPAKDASDRDIVRLMIGHDPARQGREATAASGVPLLEVSGASAPPALVDATFSVGEGEVVGVAALEGHGQLELFMTIFGAQRRSAGSVRLCGEPSRIRAPHQAVHRSPAVALVPEDRKTEGVMLRMSGKANLTLPILDLCSRYGWVSGKTERELARETMAALAVRPEALNEDVATLSGGNQQKIAIGKWLKRGARLFLMYDPTRGVDVGTKEEIYSLLRAIAAQQNAVLVYSTDIDELLTVSDRVLVMYRGRIVAQLDGATCTRSDVLSAMLGGTPGHDTEAAAS